MKKRIFTFLLALVAIATTAQAQVVLNETNFPDANFRAALASILGISEGDEITEEKIAATTSIDVNGYFKADNIKIADLKGIEYFTALKVLVCFYNQLTSLDVSKNTALTDLRCYSNQLTSLDVSKNTALKILNCGENQLTSLDVSKNTALTNLRCYSNKIKGEAMNALVESLPTVTRGSFDVINTADENEGNVCTKPQVAVAKEKGWTVYDLNGSYKNSQEYEGSDPVAEGLLLNAENFPDANFRAALASILGISEGDEITEAKIATTTTLNVYSRSIADLTGIEHFTALTYLNCRNNQLTALDVSKNTALTELNCHSNQLTSLDVSKNTALTRLMCFNNQLTSLDVSKNTALTHLECLYNQLTSLDVSKNTKLTSLWCFSNQIKGEAMDALVASLPTVEYGKFYVIDTKDENEENVCTKAQVAIAIGKGWKVYDFNGGYYPRPEYEGSDNSLSLGWVTAYKGTQITLPISLENDHQITGIQFDLYLPDGVTVATNSKGKMLISTTERMDGTYSISSNLMDGCVRILGYSADSDAFTGNSGDILNITLNIDEAMDDGDYTIHIKDIVLSDVKNTEFHPADATATLTVKSYTLGDVDNSGAININDVVCIINYILNKANGTFIENAADVDGSGSININDVVTLINRFILHRGNAPIHRAPRLAPITDTNYLHLATIDLKPGETKEVEMILTNDNTVSAAQGNIKLPEGLSFVTKSNGRVDAKNNNDRSEDFTLSCAIQDDGSLTFAHYSADGYTYEGNEGGIFTFKVKADENAVAGSNSVNLTGVVLSINGVGYDIADRTSMVTIGGTTGVGASLNDNGKMINDNYYSINGKKLNGEPTKKGIYIRNGKKVVK